MTERRDYWKNHLSGGLSFLSLPTDFPRPFPLKAVHDSVSLRLSEAASLALLRCSLSPIFETPPSPFIMLLSAFAILLHRYTGEEDLVIGSSSLSKNPVILRLHITSQLSLEQTIRSVQQVHPSLPRTNLSLFTRVG